MDLSSIVRDHRTVRNVARVGSIAAHRLLFLFGRPGLLGSEFTEMHRIGRPVTPVGDASALGARVLFVIPRYWSSDAAFQVGIAQALTVRGATCAVVSCGGIMPVCENEWREREVVPACLRCAASVRDLAGLAGIQHTALSDVVDRRTVDAIAGDLEGLDFKGLESYVWDDLPLGKHALPVARWYLRTQHPENHPDGRGVMAGLIRSGVAWSEGMTKILREFDPTILMMLNGLFLPERVSWAIANRLGRRSVFFEKGRDAGSVFISHNVAAPKYDVSKDWQTLRDIPLSPAERADIRSAMDRRSRGEGVVEQYWSATTSDVDRIRRELGLEADRPLAVLFTNVVWDTAMQDRDVAFDDMFDWLRETLQLFAAHPEWSLVVRVHPAETQLPGKESLDRVADWIRNEYPSLPSSVKIVAPDQPLDSYTLMRMANVGLVYASTAGLELAVTGVPVVVAGDAHYRGKGFTYDPTSRTEFVENVTSLMAGQSSTDQSSRLELAERYAHLFFLRRAVPRTVIQIGESGRPKFTYRSPEDLRPGRSPVLDLICDGILQATEVRL